MTTKGLLRVLVEIDEAPWGDLRGQAAGRARAGEAAAPVRHQVREHQARKGRGGQGLQAGRLPRRLGSIRLPRTPPKSATTATTATVLNLQGKR